MGVNQLLALVLSLCSGNIEARHDCAVRYINCSVDQTGKIMSEFDFKRKCMKD